jgi:hypothetical protein
MAEKDYMGRAAVKQYGPYWRSFAKEKGLDEAIKYLNKGWTNRLTAKDRKGLIQMLKSVGI